MNKNDNLLGKLVPIMLAFFAMGFVDMVGIATNYAKADFALSDTMANFLPSMVFLWFFFLSVPTSILMNKIGKKKTVLLSLIVTVVALFLPMASYSYPVMMVSFCFLGIGNTIMQVSLNPLIGCVISGDRMASALTFGQFVKAIASFIAPILASYFAVKFGNWMILYLAFGAIAVIAALYLAFSKVHEEAAVREGSSFIECFKMLGNPAILVLFLGVVSHVGIDVGVNTCAPKILIERLGIPLSEAAFATSVYFLFRTIGCLTGSYILAHFDKKKFFAISVIMMIASMVGLFVCQTKAGLYVALALVGYGNSNIFPMLFSKAVLSWPEKDNEVSGLMVMGLIGGTIFPLFMGIASDAIGSQIGSLLVISVGVIYLTVLSCKFLKRKANER